MEKSRSKKVYYNVLASGIYEVVVMLSALILPRFILGAFGSANNGLISSIGQFLSYISILTLGTTGPTRVALYRSLSHNDMRETSAILRATSRFYRKVATAFVVYMIVLAVVFPFVVDSELKWFDVASLVIFIGIGSLAEYCFGTTYVILLDADQASYIYTAIKIVFKILNTIAAIALIYAGCSLPVVKLGSAAFAVLQPIFLYLLVKKKYALVSDVEPDERALKQRGDAAAGTIANIIHNKTDIVILTLFTSTVYVSIYSVYMLVMNGIVAIMGVFTGAIEAPFGNLWAKGDLEGVRRNLRTYEFLVYIFVAVVFSCTGILVMPFVSLYTNVVSDVNYIIPEFAILVTLATAVHCIRQPYLMMVNAAGKFKETKVANYIEAGINISLSLLFVFKYGLIGVTVGTLAANLFRTIQYSAYISRNLIQRSMWEVARRLVWLTVTVCIILGIFVLFPQLVQYGSWLAWCMSGVRCFAVAAAVAVWMAWLFYKKDLLSAVKFLKRMILK